MLLQAILLSFLSVVDLATVPTASVLGLDYKGDDCCQLEWLPLIERGNKRFIPSSGVSVSSINGTRWYFMTNKTRQQFGIISEEVDKRPIFLEDRNKEGSWKGGLVLSNPHNCVIGWQRFDKGDRVWETPERQFPTFKGKYFLGSERTKFDEMIEKGEKIGYAFEVTPWTHDGNYFNLNTTSFAWSGLYKFICPLYVDCKESLKHQLTSELVDMDMDMNGISSTEHQAVDMTEIVNDSDDPQTARVDLTANINSAVEMNHETQLNSVSTTKWGVSVNMKILYNIFSFGLKSEFENSELKSNFTKSGYLSVNSKETIYKFRQSVNMKPRTKTKIVIKSRPTRGTQKFKAHYMLRPTAKSASMSNERIIRTLERLGFTDLDKIKTVNGSLVLTYDGEMSIEGGIDTHVSLESKSIANNSVIERRILPIEYEDV